MTKKQINPADYVTFSVGIKEELHYIQLHCKSFEDATKLFKSLLLTKHHNYFITLNAQKVLKKKTKPDNYDIVSLPVDLLRARIEFNGKNYVWTLLEDRLGYGDIWHLLDDNS